MKTSRRAISLSLLVLLAVSIATFSGVGVVFSQETDTSATQATMRGIFITLTSAYKFSLDPEEFQDPANHMIIQGMLQALVANANELERHGGGLNPSFGYLRRSLARDANDALDRFNQGQYMGSRFVISKITENCVTCHTKLPAASDFDMGDEFMNELKIRKLPDVERVNIELAARQFDTVLNTYEKIFADPKMTAENLALLGAFENYLRVCIGALSDTGRPISTFETFNQRSDIGASQKKLVTVWIGDLQATDPYLAEGDMLATARGLIQKAESERKHPSDRSGLVDYVTATTLLHRFIETGPEDDLEVAEAYYLMGVAESRVTRSYWISETDFLLEQAIRKAPKSEIAKQAYEFLAEYTISGHLETSAREVSPELRANLEELRALIED